MSHDGAYDLLLADLRKHIAAKDFDGRRPDEVRADAARARRPQMMEFAPIEPISDNGPALRKALARVEAAVSKIPKMPIQVPPSREERIEAARQGVTGIMAKAMNLFNEGRMSAHDVTMLELQTAGMMQAFEASLP